MLRLMLFLLIMGFLSVQLSVKLAFVLWGLAALVWGLYLLDLFWKIVTWSDKSWWE